MRHAKEKNPTFKIMSVRFRIDVYEKLEKLAAQNNRSMAGQIATLIQQADLEN